MEPAKFRCTQCASVLAAGVNLLGKTIACPKCGQRLRVPSPSPGGAAGPARATPPPPPPSPDLDLYDLEEEEEAPAHPPRPSLSPEPSTRGRGTRGAAKASAGESKSTGQKVMKVGATALFILLVGARFYSRVIRPARPRQGAVAGVPDANGALAGVSAATDLPPGMNRGDVPKPRRFLVPAEQFPPLGPAVPVAPGVVAHEVKLGPPWQAGRSPGHSGSLRLYLPEGDHAERSLPCVLIAPAGSTMLSGNEFGPLEPGGHPEHVPWAREGFAVLAYDLDGPIRDEDGDDPPPQVVLAALNGFVLAQAGLSNAGVALDFLAGRVPQVDPARILAVGHSSAATTALLVAECDERIRGCVAFAPGSYDVPPERRRAVEQIARISPTAGWLLTAYNPKEHTAALKCPLFLFTAEDDGVVPAAETRALADRFRSAGKDVTFETVPSGDHYDAMIEQGIPRAISWARGRLAQAP